jgi:glycine/D-amino acid oxidase-like deaminating enzyme
MNATVRPDFGASWYASPAGVPSDAAGFERAALTYDHDVDVCVIGGGLAGLTAAREVARRGWSVALLEARRVAWSASGRNCGFVVPGFGTDPRAMVDRLGLDRAKELWGLSAAGVAYVRNAIAESAMPGVTPVDGWLDVSKTDNGDELLALASLLGQDFGATIEGWPTERVRAVLKSERYFHAIHHPTAFHIDPLAYARGLARAAITEGVAIFEETPALAIDPVGVRKHVTTPKGRVRAAQIVLAGGAHLGTLLPRLAETVLPVNGYVAVTAPLGERLDAAITWRGAVSDSRHADYHYRVVGGDRLMWAGAGGLVPGGARGVARRFAAAIARTFPQLGAVEIAHAWSGVTGFSVHRMPQVGEVIPGLWLAGAFGAHGLNTTAMAGELIAAAITERDDRWRLFVPYELVWAGGRLGRAVSHVGAWVHGLAEDWAADLARRREAVRRAEGEVEPVAPLSEEDDRAPYTSAPTDTVQPPVAAPATPRESELVPEVEALLRKARAQAEEPSLPSEESAADSPTKTPAGRRRIPRLGRNPRSF